MIAVIIIVATVVVALFILGGAAWFAYDSDKRVRTFARSTDLIPGRPGRAQARARAEVGAAGPVDSCADSSRRECLVRGSLGSS